MRTKSAIFDTQAAKELSLRNLMQVFGGLGVRRLIFKQLSPNDNSKNQPYMAGHLTDLGFLPTGEIVESRSDSAKTSDPKRKIKYAASLDFSWISATGDVHAAPEAKLIYYPQYPEVRLSGFLTGCQFDMGGWMAPERKGRAPGRVLFLGIHGSGRIYAYLAVPQSRLAREVRDVASVPLGVFAELQLQGRKRGGDSRDALLAELRRIHNRGWIASKKLDKCGVAEPYEAENGGGFTLEAELGIVPNGFAEPDYLGWEIKQFGVARCGLIDSKVLTVMTPEPNGGYYIERGIEAFIRKYGYKSASTAGRYDFTGRHFYGDKCTRTDLTLVTVGFDVAANRILDASGYIGLVDRAGNVASSWSFAKLMKHWKEKHAKAAYIPSLSQHPAGKVKQYLYCRNIRLFTGTSFVHLLKAVASAHVYYDPGINLKNSDSKPKAKKRSQFRIKSCALGGLYDKQEDVDLLAR
jgi:hypothetical protein